MTDKPLTDSPRGRLALAVVFILVVVTAGCGFLGWVQRARPLGLSGARVYENAAFMTLRAFTFDSVYAENDQVGGNILLIVARWTGLAVFASGLVAAFASLTRTRLLHWHLSRHRRHTLIVGDHPIVAALLRASRGKGRVVHMSRHAAGITRSGGVTSVPRVDWDDILHRGRAHKANCVVIAEANVGQSAETVLQTLDWLNREQIESPRVSVHLENPTVAERFHHAQADNVFAFCPIQAAARAVLDAHPPFHLARLQGAARIHILLLDFGPLAEAILRDAVINNATCDLGKPLVSVLNADIVTQTAFRDSHPQIHSACEIRFCNGAVGGTIAELAVAAASGEPRICAAYVCSDHASDAFALAITLREHAQTTDAFVAPIFVNLTSDRALEPFLVGDERFTRLPLVGFGQMDEAILTAGVLDEDPDASARSIHEAYSAIAQQVYGAEVRIPPWRNLSEELRVSNRRVVTHTLAKLDSLGFDLRPRLALPPAKRPPLALHPDHLMFRDQADRDMAAELEHRRWMTDRWVNGWRHGAKTDRPHKIHADLVPFDKLPAKVKEFDYEVVAWLDRTLPRRPDGLKRKP